MPSSFANPAGIKDLMLFRISKVHAQGGGIVTRICEGQFGITRREWSILALLARAEEVRWSLLLEQAELDHARLSRAVSLLVAKGYASKRRLPAQGICVALTKPGRSLHDEIFPIVRDLNRRLMDGLDDDELVRLERALTLIHENAVRFAAEGPLPKADRRSGRSP